MVAVVPRGELRAGGCWGGQWELPRETPNPELGPVILECSLTAIHLKQQRSYAHHWPLNSNQFVSAGQEHSSSQPVDELSLLLNFGGRPVSHHHSLREDGHSPPNRDLRARAPPPPSKKICSLDRVKGHEPILTALISLRADLSFTLYACYPAGVLHMDSGCCILRFPCH